MKKEMQFASIDGNKVVWALPDGSLNTPRFDEYGGVGLQDVLKATVWDILGYDPGKEKRFPKIVGAEDWISCIVDRPQNIPRSLTRGAYDIGITGEDLELEFGSGNIELVDLEGGRVRLIAAVRKDLPGSIDEYFKFMHSRGRKVVVYTEYVARALDTVVTNEAYMRLWGDKRPKMRLEGYGMTVGENPDVEIVRSAGKTEDGIPLGYLVIDNMQTGSTLGEVGGHVITDPPILTSTARLYAGRHVLENPEKVNNVERIARELDAVVTARKHRYVVFNVRKDDLKAVIDYLQDENLFADEPTIIPGQRYAQVAVYIPKDGADTIATEIRGLGGRSEVVSQPTQVYDLGEEPRPYKLALRRD